jgi:hypothetical protein
VDIEEMRHVVADSTALFVEDIEGMYGAKPGRMLG